MSGKIFGGQQPVSGATVRVYQMGTSGYGAGATLLASTTSDSNGNFGFAANAYTCAYSNAPVYIVASGGNPGAGVNPSLAMAAGLGTCASGKNTTVNINEVSTIVTAYALSHFFTTSYGGAPTTDVFGATAPGSGTYNTGLSAANTQTIPTLLSLASGTINSNTATMTIESAKIYSLANSLAACVNSTGATSTTETTTPCGKLFSYTASGSSRPADTLQAAVRMALSPYQNVANIFNLVSSSAPFGGALASAPNDLTIGVSYTSSTFGLGINGSATSRTSSNIDIDAGGNVWFPSTAAGAHGLASFSPSSGTFNGPYATALVHPQYVAIDRAGTIWGTDLAGARIVSYAPSVSTTTVYSTTGFTGPVAASYGTPTADSIIFTGGGTSSGPGSTQYRLQGSAITPGATFSKAPNGIIGYGASSLAIDVSTSSASTICSYESYASAVTTRTSTSLSPCYAGGVANEAGNLDGVMSATSSNQLCVYGYNGPSCFTPAVTLNLPEGIAVDGDSNVWVANSGNASVSTMGYDFTTTAYTSADYLTSSTRPYLHNSANGNTMTMPYGIAVDRSGNVWVSNAGCVTATSTACTPGAFVLSELIGAAAPTLTPLALSNVPQTTGSRPSAVTGGALQATQAQAPGPRNRASY